MQKAFDLFHDRGARHPAQLAHHHQIFGAGEMRVEMRFFGDVSEALAVMDAVAGDRFAVEKNLAFAGLDQAGDHLERGGFAGAVRAQIACHFTRARDEADVPYRGDAGI